MVVRVLKYALLGIVGLNAALLAWAYFAGVVLWAHPKVDWITPYKKAMARHDCTEADRLLALAYGAGDPEVQRLRAARHETGRCVRNADPSRAARERKAAEILIASRTKRNFFGRLTLQLSRLSKRMSGPQRARRIDLGLRDHVLWALCAEPLDGSPGYRIAYGFIRRSLAHGTMDFTNETPAGLARLCAGFMLALAKDLYALADADVDPDWLGRCASSHQTFARKLCTRFKGLNQTQIAAHCNARKDLTSQVFCTVYRDAATIHIFARHCETSESAAAQAFCAFDRGREDMRWADTWAEKAETHNLPEAQYVLARRVLTEMCDLHRMGPQKFRDVTLAVERLKNSAYSGFKPAQFVYAACGAKGHLPMTRRIFAYVWMLRAEQLGHPAGTLKEGLEGRMTPDQLAMARRMFERIYAPPN